MSWLNAAQNSLNKVSALIETSRKDINPETWAKEFQNKLLDMTDYFKFTTEKTIRAKSHPEDGQLSRMNLFS